MFFWPRVWLAVVGGLGNYSGCKSPQPCLNQAVKAEAALYSRQPSVGEGLNKLFSWQCCQDSAEEEVPESQTLPKRLTNILCFVGLLELAFGEGSDISKLHKTHVGMSGIHVAQASRLPGSNTCSGKGPLCLRF